MTSVTAASSQSLWASALSFLEAGGNNTDKLKGAQGVVKRTDLHHDHAVSSLAQRDETHTTV